MLLWRGDWCSFDAPENAAKFEHELREELRDNPQHQLHGKDFRIVGWRRRGWKDFIVFLPREHKHAYVHLTWNRETDPRWPDSKVFENIEAVNTFIDKWPNA